MRSVMVQFREDQIEWLDTEASRSGKSRAQVVRDVVDDSLAPQFDQELADRYAAAYPSPISGVDEWGSLDAWHEAAAQSRQKEFHGENSAGAERDEW